MDIVTLAASRKYTDKKIMESGAVGIKYEVVDSLPSSGNEQTIYFVKNDSSSSNNHYDEYVWISSSSTFEKIGSSQIDGSTTQPDWNQNDDTQPDYVKNRPFYTGDPVETVLVEETTLSFEKTETGLYVGRFETTFLPIVGETYKISWDGTVHECTCEGNDLYVIGNLSITGDGADSGEPFIIVTDGEQNQIGTTDTSASHTISITGITIPVVKINPKYIRDMYYTADPVETVLVEESTIAFADAGNGLYEGKFETTFVPTVDETYKVSWDGTAYECACVGFGNMEIIGNISIIGDGADSGEPFVMGGFDGREAGIYTTDTASSSHTISISRWTTQVVKIDEKYLPDTVATKSDVETAQSTANNAQSTANNAQSTANNAQSTANNAQTTANNAKTAAENAQTTANAAKTTASAKFQLMQQNTVTTTTTIGTVRNSVGSVPVKGLNIAFGSTIKFTADNNVSGKTVWDRPTKQINMTNSAGVTLCLLGLELSNDGETYIFTNKTLSSILSNLVIEYEKVIIPKITYPARNEGAWLPPYLIADCLYLTKQSTSSSGATLYRITVDNSGTLTAKEVT